MLVSLIFIPNIEVRKLIRLGARPSDQSIKYKEQPISAFETFLLLNF